MKMLDDLKEVIDDIETQNDWEYNFVNSMLAKKERNPKYEPSINEFNVLDRIHQKYVYGIK